MSREIELRKIYSTISESLPSHHSYNSIQINDEENVDDTNYDILSQRSSKYKKYSFIFLVLSVLCAFTVFLVHYLGTSKDKILESSLAKEIPFQQVDHPEIPSSLWGTVTKPYPTGAFWTNFVVKNGDGVVAALPYGIKTLEQGVQISYGPSRRSVSFARIIDPFFVDIEVSTLETYSKRYVESWDNISVTMKYETAGGGSYKSPLVKGSPYVTVLFDNTTPKISSDFMHILSIEEHVSSIVTTGSRYIITLGNWQKWLLYTSEKLSFTEVGEGTDSLVANKAFTGYIRLAILPLQNTKEAADYYLQYVQRYPLGGTVSISYPTSSESDMTIQFIGAGIGQMLMLCLPHHAELMKFPSLVNPENTQVFSVLNRIYSMKGKMRPLVGEEWIIRYSLQPVSWNYAVSDQINTSKMDIIADSLLSDVQTLIPDARDPYAFGKQLGRMARLALIADELGIPDARQVALSNLKNSLSPWLQGQNQNILLYDKTWGGLVPSDGLINFNNNFGAGWYSDHHFQYGYFAYAMAVITKLDPLYWKSYHTAMDSLIRDICNPSSNDADFPLARHKDFFDGHSWASGLFQQGNGKGQESSSESANAYYGVYLYGLVTGNTDLSRFAHTLLEMEVHSTKTYWHMSTDDSKPVIYDAMFAANLMVGNIGGLDVTASTWFGSKLEYLHGINMMPLTPVTALLFEQSYVSKQWEVLGSRLINQTPITSKEASCSAHKECAMLGMTGACCPATDGTMLACCEGTQNIGYISDEWLAYMYIDHAVVDRESAWNQIMGMSSFGNGGSKANSLFWAASRPAPIANISSLSIHEPNFESFVKHSCTANTACDVAGLIGDCCPTISGPEGLYLGCCPTIAH